MPTVQPKVQEAAALAGAIETSQSLLFSGCVFLFTFVHWMLIAYLPVHLKALGLGGHALGGLMAAIPLTTLVLVAPFGLVSDRYSPKRLILLGVVLSAVFAAGLSLFEGLGALSAVFIVGGVGFTCFHIPFHSLYFKLLGDRQRGVRIATVFAGTVLGYGLGPFLGGAVLSHYSMRALFGLAVGGFALLALLVLRLPDAKPIRFDISHYRDDLRRPAVLFLVASTFIVASHAGVERTSLTLLMTDVVRLSTSQVGWVYACVGVWIAAIGLLAGHAFDKTRRVVVVLSLGLAWSGVFQAATALAGSFEGILAIRLLHTLGDAFFFILNPILMSLIFPNSRMGGHFGFILTITMFSTSLFAYLAGVVSQPMGHGAGFVLNGLMMVATAGAFLVFRRPIRRSLVENMVT